MGTANPPIRGSDLRPHQSGSQGDNPKLLCTYPQFGPSVLSLTVRQSTAILPPPDALYGSKPAYGASVSRFSTLRFMILRV